MDTVRSRDRFGRERRARRHARLASILLALGTGACAPPEDDLDDAEPEPIDVQALDWCIRSQGVGTLADGTEIRTPPTRPEVYACACLAVGTSPSTGSEWEAEIIARGVEQCDDGLRERGAVSTNCEDVVPAQPIEFEGACTDPE